MHDNTSGSTAIYNGAANNGVYGDDGDINAQPGGRVPSASSRGGGSGGSLRNGGGIDWSGVKSPALSIASSRNRGSDDGSSAMSLAAQQQAALTGLSMGVGRFNLGLGSPGLGGMPNGLNMAQLVKLNGMNGMNPFNMNVGMANFSAMGISPEAQLLAAQIAAAGVWTAGPRWYRRYGRIRGTAGGMGRYRWWRYWGAADRDGPDAIRRQRQERLIVIHHRK